MKIGKIIVFVATALAAQSLNAATICERNDTLPDKVDYVVRYNYNLTRNNATKVWFRLYKSGWVEQGGKIAEGHDEFKLPIKMSGTTVYNAYHSAQVTPIAIDISGTFSGVDDKHNDGSKVNIIRSEAAMDNDHFVEVKGMSVCGTNAASWSSCYQTD
jgi:hypothetical protein